MNGKKIIDVCCGSKMFWFDKSNPDVLFADIREEKHILNDGRDLVISPDIISDFTNMDFKDETFKLVVFDPPHLLKKQAGENGWMRKKYGALNDRWEEDIRKGLSECFRILEKNGILIFKWSEVQIKVSKVLSLTEQKPLFGHKSGKASNTHWICFMKTSKE